MKKLNSVISVVIIMLVFIISSCQNDKKDVGYVKKVQLNSETIAVGIYKPAGVNAVDISYIAEAINIDAGMVFVTLRDADVLNTKLENIDVVIFPGIKSGDEFSSLDKEIENIFRNFIVKKGKSAIGLCNGSGFLTCSLNQSLNLDNIKMVDSEDTTKGLIEFNLTKEGEQIFPELIGYNNLYTYRNSGSVLEFIDDSTDNITLLGQFDVGEIKVPLFIQTKSGSGKVLLITSQLESTPGMRWMIPRMVRWVQGKKTIRYDDNIVRPDLYSSAIIISNEVNIEIEKLKTKLAEGKKTEKIVAMDELQNYYPWLAAENVRLLLSERNDDLKLRAAKYLVDIEYTLAIDDLINAINKERSKKTKAKLIVYKESLERMIDQN